MRRREFIALLGGAIASPSSGLAQATKKVPRIGWLRLAHLRNATALRLLKNGAGGQEDRLWVRGAIKGLYQLAV